MICNKAPNSKYKKTITYRQLFANKLQLQAMLSYYRTYRLKENEE